MEDTEVKVSGGIWHVTKMEMTSEMIDITTASDAFRVAKFIPHYELTLTGYWDGNYKDLWKPLRLVPATHEMPTLIEPDKDAIIERQQKHIDDLLTENEWLLTRLGELERGPNERI